jgi:hypothetical protein
MEHIYIIACQRGQGQAEIHSMWNTYDGAIKAYSEYIENSRFGGEFGLSHMFFFKFPANTIFSKEEYSDIKLLKSSIYRVKFTRSELRQEYQRVMRDNKINEILTDN